MRKLLLSVMAGALGWTLWVAPATAGNTVLAPSQLKGTYVSEFDIHLNDPKSTGIFIKNEVSAGVVTAIQELGSALSKGKCPNISFPGTFSAKTIGSVLQKITVAPGDEMTGNAELTYDGNGSVIGEGVFNFFQQNKYGETSSLASFNATNTGITTRICGGPNAASLDAKRCGPVCTDTSAADAPYNCATQYLGTNSTSLNPGGGGYVVGGSPGAATTATAPFPNDVGSTSVLHFYLSAFGLCLTANSFAECCGDDKIDVVLHVPAANLPGSASQITESFGTVGDDWGSGSFHTKLSE